MTNYKYLKSLSKKELISYIISIQDDEMKPWDIWFDETFCDPSICESVFDKDGYECAYCEIHKSCKFFKDKKYPISEEEVLKLWLDAEHEKPKNGEVRVIKKFCWFPTFINGTIYWLKRISITQQFLDNGYDTFTGYWKNINVKEINK